MVHDVLGGEDSAWLVMEEATNPMVVNGVLELAERLARPRANALIERLAATPRFRARLVEPSLRFGRPAWEPDPGFDLAQHVERVELASGEDAALRAFIGGAASGLLDRGRALWRVYLIDRPGAGTTILFRIHHAIADGFALLETLLSLCDESAAATRMGGAGAAAGPSAGARRRAIVGTTKAIGRVVTIPADRRTLLKRPLGLEKRVAWSDPLALADVKAAAHRFGATVNDVLVSTAAGALGRYLARRGERTSGLELHAIVPVNLRVSAAPATLGNRFGLVFLELPVGVVDPVTRVAAVKAHMDRIKASPEALVTHALLGAIGSAPRALERLALPFFAKKASLILTNVPGPRTRLTLAGVAVSRIMFWVPQSGGMGLGLSIFSYAGEVTIGILADAGLVPDPDALVADFREEYAALIHIRAPAA